MARTLCHSCRLPSSSLTVQGSSRTQELPLQFSFFLVCNSKLISWSWHLELSICSFITSPVFLPPNVLIPTFFTNCSYDGCFWPIVPAKRNGCFGVTPFSFKFVPLFHSYNHVRWKTFWIFLLLAIKSFMNPQCTWYAYIHGYILLTVSSTLRNLACNWALRLSTKLAQHLSKVIWHCRDVGL